MSAHNPSLGYNHSERRRAQISECIIISLLSNLLFHVLVLHPPPESERPGGAYIRDINIAYPLTVSPNQICPQLLANQTSTTGTCSPSISTKATIGRFPFELATTTRCNGAEGVSLRLDAHCVSASKTLHQIVIYKCEVFPQRRRRRTQGRSRGWILD